MSKRETAKTSPAATAVSPDEAGRDGAATAQSQASGEAPPGDDAHRDLRRQMIAAAAYYRAERRGFAPGCDLEDWLAAEAEVDGLLSSGTR